MFFQKIQPLLAKGIKFTLSIEADETKADNVLVAVYPDAGEKQSALTPAMFSATAAELDAQFAEVMGSFATVTKSLKEQLEDARLVAEQSAKDAIAAATKVEKPRNGKPGKAAEADGGDGEDSVDAAGEVEPNRSEPQPVTPAVATQPASAPASLFML